MTPINSSGDIRRQFISRAVDYLYWWRVINWFGASPLPPDYYQYIRKRKSMPNIMRSKYSVFLVYTLSDEITLFPLCLVFVLWVNELILFYLYLMCNGIFRMMNFVLFGLYYVILASLSSWKYFALNTVWKMFLFYFYYSRNVIGITRAHPWKLARCYYCKTFKVKVFIKYLPTKNKYCYYSL